MILRSSVAMYTSCKFTITLHNYSLNSGKSEHAAQVQGPLTLSISTKFDMKFFAPLICTFHCRLKSKWKFPDTLNPGSLLSIPVCNVNLRLVPIYFKIYRKCLGGPRFFDVDTSGGHMAGMGQTSVHLYRRLQEITGGECEVEIVAQ